jgi:tRNA-splicing ligase RtcB
VCTDFVKRMDAALPRHGITLPDRQLSCAPASSADGQAYLAAMAAAANFAWANRHAMTHLIRGAVARVLSAAAAERTRQVYDVAHNVAKRERHGRDVLVHRKGATRAFPPGNPEIPGAYARCGQPVFIPGSMGTRSYVLAGRDGAMERSFGTVCHGAGRRMSRTGARKRIQGADLRRELEAAGITVRCPSNKGLAEEAPFAYKAVEQVVGVVERAGLAARVAELRPIGVVKG